MPITTLLAVIYPICLVWAAYSDITTMTIPNRLTLGLAIAFVPVALLNQIFGQPLSLQGWGFHFGIGLAGLVLGMALFAFRVMGGGDAKLIAAAALWVGPGLQTWYSAFAALLIYTAIFGGVLSIVIILARKLFWGLKPNLPEWAGRHLEAQGDIPYGIGICAGGLFAVGESQFLHALKFWS